MPIAEESGMRPIPISAKQLETLAKLAEARARIRLSTKATKEDAEGAIGILKYFLLQVGYDEKIKSFDIDRIRGISLGTRKNIALVMKTLEELEERLGKFIPREELLTEVKEKLTEDEVNEVIQKLMVLGNIFIPRKGFIQRI